MDKWTQFVQLAQYAIKEINRSYRDHLRGEVNWDNGRGVAEGITRGMAVIWEADPIWVETVLYRMARLERDLGDQIGEAGIALVWAEAASQWANDDDPTHPAAYLENALDLLKERSPHLIGWNGLPRT